MVYHDLAFSETWGEAALSIGLLLLGMVGRGTRRPGDNGMSKRTKPPDPIARRRGRYLAQRLALALMFALVLGACAPSGTGSVSVPVQPWYCYEARDDYCPIEPTELGRPYTLTPW
jgi:hypothetical protein